MEKHYILVINPGSTSTQVALFNNKDCLFEESIAHTMEELSLDVEEQVSFRKESVLNFIKKTGIDFKSLNAIAARGGRLKPIPSGTYLVNDLMLRDSFDKENGNHASRLAVIIGNELAQNLGCNVYSVDPVSVDEMIDVSKISGMPEIERRSLSHALNMKAVGRKTAEDLNQKYENLNLVVAHLGGGTTISSHRKGQMIDLINDFEGGFTPERSGGLPNLQLVKLCFSGEYSEKEIIKKMESLGGFYAYLGTKDFLEIENKINNGDKQAKLIMDAYIYQIIKVIGSMLAVLKYKVDAISLTGSISKSKNVVNSIKTVFSDISPVMVYPGSFEIEALAHGVLRVLQGEERPRQYPDGEVLS